MDKILGQYGKVVVSVTVAIALMYMFFNVSNIKGTTGVTNIIAENTEVTTVDYENRLDTEASIAKSNRNAPTFSTMNLNQITSQKEIDLFEFITAHDQDGNQLKVKIKSIMDISKNEYVDQLQEGRYFTFSRSGAYQLKVYTIDQEKADKTQVIDISVNRGR